MRKWKLFGFIAFNVVFIAAVVAFSIACATTRVEVAPDPDLVTNSYGLLISDGPESSVTANVLNIPGAIALGLILFFGSYLFLGAIIWLNGMLTAAIKGIAEEYGGPPLTSKRTAPEKEEIVVISEKHHIYRIGSRIYNVENGVTVLLNDLND